jgi:hypothetical protein
MKDLVCLVADKNMEAALRGLLERHQALRLRQLSFDLQVHPRRDPGCYNAAHEFLQPLRASYELRARFGRHAQARIVLWFDEKREFERLLPVFERPAPQAGVASG